MKNKTNFDARQRLIEEAKSQGVPAHLVLAFVAQESSFKTDAKNPNSNAYGLFQFTDAAWADYGITKAKGWSKRDDPETQIKLGVKRIKQSVINLRDQLGRDPDISELYMSHVFGPTGGSVMASGNPNESILSNLTRSHKSAKGATRVLAANPWIRKNGIATVKDMKNYFAKKMAGRVSEVEPIIQKYAKGELSPSQTTVADLEKGGNEDDDLSGSTTEETTEAKAILASFTGEESEAPKSDVNDQEFVLSDEEKAKVTEQGISDFDGAEVPTDYKSTDFYVRDKESGASIPVEVTNAGERSPNIERYKDPGATQMGDFLSGKDPQPIQPSIKVEDRNLDSTPQMEDQQPYKPLTRAQEAQLKKDLEENTPGYWEGVKKSAEVDWIWSWALDGHDDYKPDPNFSMTEDWLKENAKTIPSEYWEDITYAWSEEHARGLIRRIERNIDLENELAKFGWQAIPMRILVSMFDPVAIGALLATGGGASELVAASKLSKWKKVLATGGIIGAESAALEALLVNEKPLGSYEDIVYAGLGGFGIGTLASSFRKFPTLDSDDRKLYELTKEAQKDIDDSLDVIDPAGKSAGARHVGTNKPISDAADEALFDAADAPYSAFTGFKYTRFDVMGRLKSSNHDLTRKTADGLAEDAVGNRDHSKVTFGASEYQSQLSQTMEARHWREVVNEFNQWSKDKKNGVTWRNRATKRAEFMDKVTEVVRDTSGLIQHDPHIMRAAQKQAKLYDNYLTLAKSPGALDGKNLNPVKGFDEVDYNGNYTPRIYDEAKLRRNLDDFGDDAVGIFFGKAMKAAIGDAVTEAEADKFGKYFVRSLKANTVQDMSITRALSGEELGTLREILVRDAGLDEKTFDKVANALRGSDKDSGKHARAKQRRLMEENYKANIADKYGNYRSVSVSDFLVNDAERLFRIYNRQMSGAISLARAGFDSKGALETRIRQIKQSAAQVKDYTKADLDEDVKRLEFLGTMITGTPVGDYGASMFKARNSRAGQASKLVRDYNFIRIMNQVGAAQLGEMGNIVTHVGIKTALSNMPGFKSLIRDVKSGQLRDDLARELEAAIGIGTDRLRNNSLFRHDDFGSFVDPDEGGFLNKVENVLEVGKRATADVSGMTAINNVLQRWASRAVAQKMVEFSKNPGKHWGKRRLSQAGLDLEDLKKITDQINLHSTTEKGILTKHKLTQLNLDAWDPEARGLFISATNRISKRMIQENDPGNMHEWASLPFYQIIFQFRQFMLVSHAKQLLSGLHARDINTGMGFLMSSVTAAMAYTLQTGVMAAGRPDAAEYMEERLSTDRIAAAAFARAGWASLVPMAVDNTLTNLFEADPIFDVRSSGLSAAGFGQNPTTQFVSDGIRTIGSVIGAGLWDDKSFTEGDFNRATMTIVPLQNAIVINQFLRNIGTAFPEDD